jgi:hypothetical protein
MRRKCQPKRTKREIQTGVTVHTLELLSKGVLAHIGVIVEGEMTPAAKAFVLVLLERISELEAKVEELSGRDPKLTPKNSSLPPSSQHPPAKSKTPKSKGSRKRRGAQPGHPKHDRELIPSDQCDQAQTRGLPKMWSRTQWRGFRSIAVSSMGIA